MADVPPATERSALVLSSERGDLPAIEAVEENIRRIFHASNSPRIELFSEYLDFTRNGRSTAELALKILRGQWIPYGAPETENRNPLLINWEALKKAQLPESQVPVDAEVRRRPASLWETHRTFVFVVAGAIFVQAVLDYRAGFGAALAAQSRGITASKRGARELRGRGRQLGYLGLGCEQR